MRMAQQQWYPSRRMTRRGRTSEVEGRRRRSREWRSGVGRRRIGILDSDSAGVPGLCQGRRRARSNIGGGSPACAASVRVIVGWGWACRPHSYGLSGLSRRGCIFLFFFWASPGVFLVVFCALFFFGTSLVKFSIECVELLVGCLLSLFLANLVLPSAVCRSRFSRFVVSYSLYNLRNLFIRRAHTHINSQTL